VWWLDPQPALAIQAALYPKRYYTHAQSAGAPTEVTSFKALLRRAILSRTFGYPKVTTNVWVNLASRTMGRWRVVQRWAGNQVRFLPFRETGRLLDIGCGNGAYLQSMAKLGWQVEGVEPDDAAAALARRAGLTVHNLPLEAVSLEPDHYDAITLHHVLEHLPDAVAALTQLRTALRPGGTLVSVSPNPSGSSARRFKANWRGLDAPRHLALYGPPGLRRLARKAGLTGKVWTMSRPADVAWTTQKSLASEQAGNYRPAANRWRGRAITAGGLAYAALRPEGGDEVVLIASKSEK
jgi:2-polyprenyl-3-methyl-5-hydroxy-6-metoxy-1,4-benzoquinol methylase